MAFGGVFWKRVKNLRGLSHTDLGLEKSDIELLRKAESFEYQNLAADQQKLLREKELLESIRRAEADFRALIAETEQLDQIEKLEQQAAAAGSRWAAAPIRSKIAALAKQQKIDSARAEEIATRLKSELQYITNVIEKLESLEGTEMYRLKKLRQWLNTSRVSLDKIAQALNMVLANGIPRTY
ncbi:MAG TPA: hypothetical protein HA224_01160 [Nanoarchaeota archaeon]|nr:hypothetical protein [Nanoarchaeota archaeon]